MVKKHHKIGIWLVVVVLGISTAAAHAKIVDRIIALVNSDIITQRQLDKITQRYRQQIDGSQGTDDQKKQRVAQLEKQMLDQLVEISLAKQEAKKYGISVAESDVDKAIDNFKKANNLDDDALVKGLAAEGMTLKEYRERMRDQILQSLLINRTVRSKIIVTEEDIKAYYKAHPEMFEGQKKYHLRNILTKTEAEMKTVLARLAAHADFQALAKEFSIGSNAAQGGDLGLFDLTSFSQEIKEAVEGLEKGGHTNILQTESGYQIIYVDDIVMEGNQTPEEAEDKIREILYRSQGEQTFKAWMEKLKKNAHIKLML